MNISYAIEEEDFLTHQLYIASKSERIKRKWLRNKLLVPLIYIPLALLLFFKEDYMKVGIFFLVSMLWFFLYPIWEKKRYRNHYKAFIQENYKNRIGRELTLTIENDFLFAQDSSTETKMQSSEIEEIKEIPTLLLIQLKSGQAFIIPKRKIADISALVARLKDYALYLKIPYSLEEKWVW